MADDDELAMDHVSSFLRNAHESVVESCLEQVSDMKLKIAKHYEETWAEKESEYKEKIEKQEELIKQLQAKVQEADSHTEVLASKNQEITWGAAMRHMFHKQMSSGSISVRKIFTVWFKYSMMMKSERQLSHVADRVAKRRLAARVLTAWDRVARGYSRNKLERAAERKLETVTKEIINRYETEVQKLRSQIGLLQQEILDGHRRRQILEDELRRTLLKGMAAMNMEALSIFSSAAATDNAAAAGLAGP